jgi:REP element-mobilizing transposase RayT
MHLIDSIIENELYAYLGGICNNLECQVLKVGGYTNHIHILCLLSKKITLAKLLAEVKANSSRWMKTKGEKYQNFYWQDGYGAFSVRQSEVQVVSKYIANQKEHHNKRSFKDEYRDVLKEHGVEFDEKYVWD